MPILLVEWSAQISEVIDKDLSDSTTSAYSTIYIELDAVFIMETMYYFLKWKLTLSKYKNLIYLPMTHLFFNH